MTECERMAELISAELDGELSPAEKETLRAHLESCAACRRYRDAVRAVSGALTEELQPVPDTLAPDIMARIASEARPSVPEKKPARVRYIRWGALAACLMLVLVGTLALRRGGLGAGSPAAAPAMFAAADTAAAAPMEPRAAAPAAAACDSAEESVTEAACEPQAADNSAGVGVMTAAAPEPVWERAAVLCRGEEIFAATGETALRELSEGLLSVMDVAPAPARESDYILSADTGGATLLYGLWIEGDAVWWAGEDGDAALSVWTAEELRAYLGE